MSLREGVEIQCTISHCESDMVLLVNVWYYVDLISNDYGIIPNPDVCDVLYHMASSVFLAVH